MLPKSCIPPLSEDESKKEAQISSESNGKVGMKPATTQTQSGELALQTFTNISALDVAVFCQNNTVKEMRDMCRKRDLILKGTKEQLAKRLLLSSRPALQQSDAIVT